MAKSTKFFLIALFLSLPVWWGVEKKLEDFFFWLEIAKNPPLSVATINPELLQKEIKKFKPIRNWQIEDLKIEIEGVNQTINTNKALIDEFDEQKLRFDHEKPKSSVNDFPVLRNDNGKIVSSLSLSQTLNHIPPARAEFIFAHPEISSDVTKWVEKNKKRIIELKGEK
jgi:hypothetical protein